jgi:hypothetical protein
MLQTLCIWGTVQFTYWKPVGTAERENSSAFGYLLILFEDKELKLQVLTVASMKFRVFLDHPDDEVSTHL